MSIKEWYNRNGFFQFMLGREWNDPISRSVGGRGVLIVEWMIVLFALFVLFGD